MSDGVVLMKNGSIRTVRMDLGMMSGYRFTDCTHPAQNAYVETSQIEVWLSRPASLPETP